MPSPSFPSTGRPDGFGLPAAPAACKGLTALTLALALAGCALTPAYHQPEASIPSAWPEAPAAAATASAPLAWQDFVLDADLRALVQAALDHNRDLRQTLLNIEAARAQYRIQRADRLPGLDAQASGTRQRTPADLSASGSAAVGSNLQAGVGLTAFELDLFGRVRSLSQAALQDYLATEQAGQSARIALVAEVLQACLAQDGARRRLALTRQTLDSREASLRLMQQRRANGAASALDEQDARGLAHQARAELARTERELAQAGHALRLLVGDEAALARYAAGAALPARASAPATSASGVPVAPAAALQLVQDLAPGLPSDLLARRPDILAAEHQLRARQADIGAARAAFFPRISLTAFLGSASGDLSRLFEGGQGAWSFAPQISLPLFDAGRNRANLDLARVRQDQAVARYEASIQGAFREVADALSATDTLRREEAARADLARSADEALRLAEARWRAGVDSHLRMLDAQRSQYARQIERIDASTQRQVALVTLFKALGGGWGRAATPATPAVEGVL